MHMAIKKSAEEVRQAPGRGRTVTWILWISVTLAALGLFLLLVLYLVRVQAGPGIVGRAALTSSDVSANAPGETFTSSAKINHRLYRAGHTAKNWKRP